MEFDPTQLAVLEHLLEQAKDDRDRSGFQREKAAEMLGMIQGEIEFRKYQNKDLCEFASAEA